MQDLQKNPFINNLLTLQMVYWLLIKSIVVYKGYIFRNWYQNESFISLIIIILIIILI